VFVGDALANVLGEFDGAAEFVTVGFEGLESVAGALADHLPLQLGKDTSHLGHGSAHGSGCVDAEVEGDEVPGLFVGEVE